MLALYLCLLASAPRLEAKGTSAPLRFHTDGPRIVDLRAGGSAAGRLAFAREIAPEGWDATPNTRVLNLPGHTEIGPLAVHERRTISVREGTGADVAAMLTPGHTLGQTFRVPEGTEMTGVSIHVPTWNTADAGATLTLWRGEERIAERRLTHAVDNAWQEIRPASPQGPGLYTVTLSAPVGTIGWWSIARDAYVEGHATVDGKPVAQDRHFEVTLRRLAGRGVLKLTEAGSRLRIEAALKPLGKPLEAMVWRWRAPWRRDGYDCTAAAGVAFRRFYTDNQRYMPAEQLKRRDQAGLSFSRCRWIEMEGTEGAGLRLSGEGLGLDWTMAAREMTLQLTMPLRPDGARRAARWQIERVPAGDRVPTTFPRFECSDRAVAADLNRLWWERAFTYPGPAGPAAWFEWMSLVRAWYRGPQRDGEMRQMADYPITAEGYVHTWGASIGWPFPGPPYDTRHFDTNARFILGCWRYYLWSGDRAFLRRQAARLQAAMRYQLDALHGRDGLIVAASKDVTGRHKGVGDNYWDILPFGHLDAYANVVFYASLEAMAQIDRALGAASLVDYATLRRRVRERYNAEFWDERAGRYIGCIDVDGARHDYGFTFVNMEALYYGLGDEQKARRIYHWMETEPTSTGRADTYARWIFAPRANTIHNPMWADNAPVAERASKTPPWWHFGWLGTPYGEQCQDGGAILYTSYFDLMARQQYLGADNAWRRFGEILARYRLPDRLCGGPPLLRGERPQQEDPGSVGLDLPFPESGLVPCYFLYGVLGVRMDDAGLHIRPNLPRALSWAGVRSLDWGEHHLAIRVTGTSVEVTGHTRGGRSVHRRFTLRPGAELLLPANRPL